MKRKVTLTKFLQEEQEMDSKNKSMAIQKSFTVCQSAAGLSHIAGGEVCWGLFFSPSFHC